jgi:hypothetical protein
VKQRIGRCYINEPRKEDYERLEMKIVMSDGSSLTIFDECVALSWNRNITCFLSFINFESLFFMSKTRLKYGL